MTVAELIAELQNCQQPDLDVYLESECCGCSVLAEEVCLSMTGFGTGIEEPEFVAVSG